MQRFFLVIDSVETEIQQPEGWGEMTRQISRQMDTFGFMEEFSKSDLTFYCDGSDLPGGLELIQAAYDAKGPDADVYFKVLEDCNDNGVFETINNSLLDLYEAPNNADWYKTPAEAESFQTILSKRYKSQTNLLSDKSLDNTPVAVPVLKEVFLPGKAIVREYEAFPLIDTRAELKSGDPDTNANQRNPVLYFGFDNLIRNEFGTGDETGNSPGVYTLATGFSFTRDPLISIFDAVDNARLRFYINIDSDIVIERNKGDFESVNINYYLTIKRADLSPDTSILLETDVKTGINGAYTGVLTTGGEQATDFIDLKAGDKVYLWGDIFVGDVSGPYRMTYRVTLKKTSYLRIEGYTVSVGSNGYGLLLHEAFSKAITNLTGKENIFISKYLGRIDSAPRAYPETGCGGNFLFTIGKLLKGRLKEKDKTTDIPLTTSLSTLFEGQQSIFCTGYSYEYEAGEERVVIEDMEYFFQNYEIISFDNVSDFEIAPAQDLIFNTIDVGYEKYETEEVNGADEFNSKRQYATPIRKHESKLNLLSKLVTGGYPIEFTRQSRLKTNDYKYDNNNFLIAVTNETTAGGEIRPDVSYGIILVNSVGEVAIDPNSSDVLTANFEKITVSGRVNDNGDYTLLSWYTGETLDELGNSTGTANFLILDPPLDPADQFGTVNIIFPDVAAEPTTITRAKQDDAFVTLANVVDPSTTYNAEISPARNLLRWAKYINGGLTFKAPEETIRFTYGEANYLLQSQLKETEECLGGDVNRELLKENQDFTLSAFNEFNKLWIAEYITFKTECSYDEFLTIRESLLPAVEKANKNGYISVEYLDDIYQGFPIDVSFEPNKRICTFKLLRKYMPMTTRREVQYIDYVDSNSFTLGFTPSRILRVTVYNDNPLTADAINPVNISFVGPIVTITGVTFVAGDTLEFDYERIY